MMHDSSHLIHSKFHPSASSHVCIKRLEMEYNATDRETGSDHRKDEPEGRKKGEESGMPVKKKTERIKIQKKEARVGMKYVDS